MTTSSNCMLCKIAGILVIIGALNWGMIGILQMNIVAKFLGDMTMASRIVYSLVGVAGLLKLVTCFKDCPGCCKK